MILQKIKEWVKRYLPAEIVGTITAVSAASIAHIFSDNHIFIAYIATLGEAIGFFSTIFIQYLLIFSKKRKTENRRVSLLDISKIVSHILLEFGPAEIIDSLVLRPFFMYLFPLLVESFTLGIFLGKIAGDITFYLLVILSYEMKKKLKFYKQ
jgi:hypothetical protein